ncbi:hypothetical protein BCR35DRAFT_329986 [Leucosporidium creatinivorum]|uniref:Uncharacterized protein n=1 Tax=Leucosporidium creatinivorum TaxID=106004 RepID=A0A1Y2FWM0_9BASI|nr:hypothetical protein BCR35DRAFT_329986 [Leucosporidium creatinivorum]
MSHSIHTLPDIPPNAAHSQPLTTTHAESESPNRPPPLPFTTSGWRWLKPAGYVILLLVLNLVVPLVCFYSLRSRSVCPPGVLVLLEDSVGVDWAYGVGWRRAVIDRYHASPGFRRLMWWQTVWWTAWGGVYIAVTAVVAWVADITFAFGWCAAGSFFLFALLSGVGSYMLSKWGLERERREWALGRHAHTEEEKMRRSRRRRGVVEV